MTKQRLYLLSFIILGCAFMLPLWHVGLNCDDFMYAMAARGIQPLWELPGAHSRPLSTALLVAWIRAADLWPALLPALRVAHHGLNAALVAAVARRLQGSWFTGAVAGAAFLLWGSHGELGYYSALHDMLAATGVLAALLLTGRAALTPLLALACAAAYLSKESAWVLPGVLALLTPTPHRLRSVLVSAGTWVLVMAARVWAVGFRGELEPSIYHDVSARRLAASVTKLLMRTVVPGAVNVRGLVMTQPWLVGGVAAAGAAACAWGLWRHRGPLSGRLLLCYALALAPVCMLSVSLSSGENSRYLYLPCVFVALLLAHAARQASTQVAMAMGLLLALQGGGSWVTQQRWVQASQLTANYAQALTRWLATHPGAGTVYLACVPDNYLGALAARNVSEQLALQIGRPLAVLNTVYESADTPRDACTAAALSDREVVLSMGHGSAALTHPFFNAGEVLLPPRVQTMTAQALTHDLLTPQITVQFADADWTVAVYSGDAFHTLTGAAPDNS